MAKAKTAVAPKPKKKTSKASKAVTLKAAPKGAKKDKPGKKSKADKGADVLWKLAEHPLVGELLAIGATAAVAAIAEGSKDKRHRSSAAVKQAGKAAAAAIGARLISEFTDVKKPAKAKPAKS